MPSRPSATDAMAVLKATPFRRGLRRGLRRPADAPGCRPEGHPVQKGIETTRRPMESWPKAFGS